MLNISDEEIDIKISKLLQELSVNFSKKNISQANYVFQVLWNYTYNHVLIRSTKKRNELILPVLFNVITTYPIVLMKVQIKACSLFCELLRNPKLFPDNMHFSMEKVLYVYKMLFCQKDRLFIMKANDSSDFFNFFSHVRYFFNEDDAKNLIKKYFYRLGNPDILSLKSLMIICRFFPPKYFRMIINDLLVLLRNYTSATWINAIISFINESIKYENFQYSQKIERELKNKNTSNFDRFDWTPYLDTFFNNALIFLNPKVNINGINFSANTQIKSISIYGFTEAYELSSINYISKLIPLLIIDGKQGDEALKYFEKFINILAPLFFTSSNLATANQVKREECGNANKVFIICSNNEIQFALFIELVISEFHHINKKALRQKSINKTDDFIPISANQNQINEFVRIILPIIQTAIFRSNQYIQKYIIESIRYLAELDFPQVSRLLLEQSVENIIDDEMSHFSLSCKEIILKLIPSMITDEKILIETKDFFPKIIYSAIECLSNVNENIYFIGLSILGNICQFFEANDKKDELAQDEIQQVESCRKSIVQCLENTFDQFIEYTISHEEHSMDSNEIILNDIQKKPFYFISYFLSFEDSFLESKIPYLIDTIDQSMEKSAISNILHSLFDSKPFLLNFIIPKMLDRLDKAMIDKDKKKMKYYSEILSKLCIFYPYFIPFLNDYKKRIDILFEECTLNSFKCASLLLFFVKSFAFKIHTGLVKGDSNLSKLKEINGVTINDKEKMSLKKWEWLGKEIDDLKIFVFYYNDEFIIEQLDYFIQKLEQLEKIFFNDDENQNDSKSINFKIQKKIHFIFQMFSCLFEAKGQFCQIDPISYKNLNAKTAGVSEVDLRIKTIESFIRNLIIKGIKKYKDSSSKNSNSLKLQLMVQLANNYIFQIDNEVLLKTLILNALQSLHSQFKNKNKKPLLIEQVKPFTIFTLTKCMYKPEYDGEIIDLIYEISHTMNPLIFDLSISIISMFGGINKEVYHDIALKELQVLENKKFIETANLNDNKDALTKEQCITALAILTVTCSSHFLHENEYLTRLLKAIMSLKFDKKWNISKYLFGFYKAVSFMRDHFEVKDDQIWRDFINSIIPTMKTSGDDSQESPENFDASWWMTSHEIFFMFLDLIAFQKPPVSLKFIQFELNTCLNLSEPTRLNCFISLSNLFARMKPRAKKVLVDEIRDETVFDDRCHLYFTEVNENRELKHLYTIYDGPSEFDTSDGYQRLREVIFDFFTSEKIGLFVDSIALFMNEKTSNNEDNENTNS